MEKSHWLFKRGTFLFIFALSLVFASCDENEEYIWVDDNLPDASLEYVASVYDVEFTNSSSDATYYYWDFGNGTTYSDDDGTLETVTKTYTDGTYTVMLYAYDNNGAVDIDTQYVSLPYLSFNVSDVDWGTITFQNNDTESNSWDWDFGDGSTSTDENPVHEYTQEGSYTVTLVASSGTASNTYEETVYTDSATIASPLFEDENDWKGADGSGDAYSESGAPTPIAGTGAKVESKHDGLCQTVKVFPNQDYRITFYAAIDDGGAEGYTVPFYVYSGQIDDNSEVTDADKEGALYYENLAVVPNSNTYTSYTCDFTTDDTGYITISATYVDVTTRYCVFDIDPL